MTHDELLAKIKTGNEFAGIKYAPDSHTFALRAVVELHKPYDSQDAPHEVAMGWCKGCSIKWSEKEYASQIYPCPTIQAIEKELL